MVGLAIELEFADKLLFINSLCDTHSLVLHNFIKNVFHRLVYYRKLHQRSHPYFTLVHSSKWAGQTLHRLMVFLVPAHPYGQIDEKNRTTLEKNALSLDV